MLSTYKCSLPFWTDTCRWYHDGAELRGNEENIQIDYEGTLIFESVTARDNGAYTCLAENERGDIKKVVEILVHGQLRLNKLFRVFSALFAICCSRFTAGFNSFNRSFTTRVNTSITFTNIFLSSRTTGDCWQRRRSRAHHSYRGRKRGAEL